MDLNSLRDLKRLEEQIFQYKPTIKSTEKKKCVSDRLRNQLLQSKAVVKIQRLDAECESLMISLKKRLMFLQDILIPQNKEINLQESQEVLNDKDELELNLSSESSDDETLSSLISKQENVEKKNLKMQQADTTAPAESDLPLALRRKPRERRLSYKSFSSASTSGSKKNRNKLQKNEHTANTSVEHFIEQEEIDTPTLHIKIPSLYRGNVHCIILDSLDFARKVFDFRANEAKQRQQKTISNDSTKAHRKPLKCASVPVLQKLTQQEQDLDLTQFIQDVMTETCIDETLQATSALESINNNLTGNYDLVENDTFINYSQSSEEFSYSQNSSVIVDTACSTSEVTKVRKKRKYSKPSNKQQQNEPKKKRGRKPRKINDSDTAQLQPQPPTKSNLAQYVELFSNDCAFLPPGSTTPASSSTRSQPLVSSTTHNFEVVDQLPQQEQQNLSLQPITYYIDGDWANGGPCQLVTTNGVSVDDIQLNQDSVAVQNFVNCIDNSCDSRNNIIATTSETNNNLPISIPQSLTNNEFQNKNHHQATHQIHNRSTGHISLLPTINIHIPPLSNNICSSGPPAAHVHKEVVDLSIKSKASANVTSTEAFNLIEKSNKYLKTFRLSEDNECLPLDLSVKCAYDKEKNSVTIDTQDEDFIRNLIEQSDFDYSPDELKKIDENGNAVYDHENSKSYKSALDMPLLDFDATDLSQLVGNATTTSSQKQNTLPDKIDYNGSKNNENSNFESIITVNSSIQNNLHFCKQSTNEIFNKLLGICPDNHFLIDMTNDFIVNDNNESAFDQSRVENSTMCEVENPTTQRNQLDEAEEEAYNETSEVNQEIENTSNDEPTSSNSLAVQIDRSNTTKDMSLNLIFSDDNDSNELKNRKLSEEINLQSASNFKINNEISNNEISNNFLTRDEEESFIGVGNSKTVFGSSRSDTNNGTNNESTILKANNAKNTKTTFHTKDIMLSKENNATIQSSLKYSHVQSKENIVFSVAKITLSKDDNLYSDSDSSSEKPCEFSEVKTLGNGNNITEKTLYSYNLSTDESVFFFKDNTESDKEVEVVEKFQNVEQELPDVSENIDYTKVDNGTEAKKILDSKNSSICNEKFELELESHLECVLDFDEDFDDALSLSTSCFDSPNDERFEGSIVDVNTTTTTNTLQVLQQHESHPNFQQIMDLKNFKIPKRSNSTDAIMVPSKSVLIKFDNSQQSNFVSKAPNIEKITRTINTDVDLNLEETFLGNGKTIVENVILKVFGVTCLPFLVDKCNDKTYCQLTHELNDSEKVYQNLYILDKTHANLAYQVMYNHSKLFKLYFNIFCTYYTNKNDRMKLLNMVNDCARYPEYAEFIIVIYEGLVQCGLSRINACRLVLKCIHEKNIATSIVEALVALIMKSDWTIFTNYIKKFTEDTYQFKFSICILEQMAPAVLNSKGTHLKQVFGKCFQTLHRDDTALFLNSPILMQCVALLTTNT